MILGLLILFNLGRWSVAEDTKRGLSLEQFTRLLVDSHPYLKAESLSTDVEEARAEAINRNENWSLDIRPSYRYEEPVSSSLFAAEEVTSFGGTAEINRAIWSSGGALRLGYSGSSVEQTVNPISFPGSSESGFQSVLPEFFSHRAFIGYSQPLFKNRGGKQDRLPADLQAFQVQARTLQSLENAEDFLLSRSKDFLDWALLSQMAEIAENREALASALWKETEKERDANYVDEVDLIRAENNYIQAQQRSLDLKSRAQALGINLALVLGDATLQKASPETPVFNAEVKEYPEVQSQTFRVLKLLELNTLSLERELERYRNSKLVDLSLELMGGLASGGEQFDDSSSFDQPLAQVGLVFRHPLGKHPDDAQSDRLKLEVVQSQLRRQHAQRNIEGALLGLHERMNGLAKVIHLNQQQVVISLKKTEAEEAMYRQGRSSLNFVIQSRDEEAMIQSQLVENTVEFRKLELEYDALRDGLFFGF